MTGLSVAGRFDCRAVIFDYNGTLMDDEEVLCGAYQEALGELGIELPRERYFGVLAGLGEHALVIQAAALAERQLTRAELDKVIRLRVQAYLGAVAAVPPLRNSARELIMRLAARVPMAVVSGALFEEVEAGLVALGLRPYFSVLVTDEDVAQAKPDPEGYVLALSRLNSSMAPGSPIKAHEVVVFEDSHYGVKAAKAAGTQCIAVRGTAQDDRLVEADLIVDDLSDVIVSPSEEAARK